MTDSVESPTRAFEGTQIPNPGTYTIDPVHSDISFSIRHMMVSKVRGRFSDLSGTITIAENPLESSVEVNIAVASLDTGNPDRDGHVKSGDFLDSETYPEIIFSSTGVSEFKGDSFTLTGDLTVRGVTKSVSFKADYNGVGKNPYERWVLGFDGQVDIDRETFGVEYNAALETGGVLLGKVVTLDLSVQATQG